MKKTVFTLILLVVVLLTSVALARSMANSQANCHSTHSINAAMQHGERKDRGAHDRQHEHGAQGHTHAGQHEHSALEHAYPETGSGTQRTSSSGATEPTGTILAPATTSATQSASRTRANEATETVPVIAAVDSPFATAEVIEELEAVAAVRKVGVLLVTETSDGTTVFGVDVQSPLQLLVDGQLVTASILNGGRELNANDAGRPVMLVGKTFAEGHNSALGYPILGMVSRNPPYILEGQQVSTVGVLTTEIDAADSAVVLPLAFAEKLSRQSGKANAFLVTADADQVVSVKQTVREALGAQLQVAVPQ